MELLTLVIVAFLMLSVGVPIGIAICSGLLALSFIHGTIDVSFIAQAMYTGQETLPILAVPCFMLAGDLMQQGGLTDRLVNIAKKMTGHTKGGLGNVTVLASMFFGAISGSGPATTSAIGGNMIPAMVKDGGYDPPYAAGVSAVAGSLGIIIPPSIPFVIYGCATSTSVGKLFLAGIIPGILVGCTLMAANTALVKHYGYVRVEPKAPLKDVLKAVWDGKWACFMPIMILGGIYSGVFTPTEASVIAVFYGVFVGKFVYKELTWTGLWKTLKKTATSVGGFMLAYAPACALGSTLVLLNVTTKLSGLLSGISSNVYVILFIIVVFLMITGMFLDTNSNLVVFGPILYTVLAPMGVSPIHLGVIMIVTLGLGFVTPPVCMTVFVASNMTKIPMEKIVKPILPMIATMFVVCLLLAFIPELSLLFA